MEREPHATKGLVTVILGKESRLMPAIRGRHCVCPRASVLTDQIARQAPDHALLRIRYINLQFVEALVGRAS